MLCFHLLLVILQINWTICLLYLIVEKDDLSINILILETYEYCKLFNTFESLES